MSRENKLTLSPEQRAAIRQAQAILQPHFAGETLKLYVPLMLPAARAARRRRIWELHAAGMPPRQIASIVGVSLRYVYSISQRGFDDGDA